MGVEVKEAGGVCVTVAEGYEGSEVFEIPDLVAVSMTTL